MTAASEELALMRQPKPVSANGDGTVECLHARPRPDDLDRARLDFVLQVWPVEAELGHRYLEANLAGGSGIHGKADTHPVALPRIMLQILFPNPDHGTDGWRLVSDSYPMSERGGASLHADFVNGWDTTIMNRWLNACIRDVKDCERSELGGGEALEFSFFVP